jgi:hypothetical protein
MCFAACPALKLRVQCAHGCGGAPAHKNRMKSIASFDDVESQLRAFMARTPPPDPPPPPQSDTEFNRLAAALFSLQAASVPVYREFCARRKISSIQDWREIPALPASAFKEYEVTSLPPDQRAHVFHSSGTTGQRPGRHFHNAQSLALYEDSLLRWFLPHFLNSKFPVRHSQLVFLTPSAALAPRSSLARMMETIARQSAKPCFAGRLDSRGSWTLDLGQTAAALSQAQSARQPVALLGTAFSFVHLLDHCQASRTAFRLPEGSRAMETGGYKGRSRVVAKLELRQMITRWLGIPESHILAEYGMSELSSQAYDRVVPGPAGAYHFPPWARAQVVSPETGREVGEGKTGMVRVFDLANLRSVLAVQTEDMAARRADGFELIGRAAEAEPRGCSLMLEELTTP